MNFNLDMPDLRRTWNEDLSQIHDIEVVKVRTLPFYMKLKIIWYQ